MNSKAQTPFRFPEFRSSQARPSQTALVVFACLVCIGGCSPSGPPRVAVQGNVTLDGKSLEWAAIVFHPEPGVSGPMGSGRIAQGKYKVDPEHGPAVGKLRVEIWSDIEPGADRDIRRIEPLPQPALLPARYNKNSTLVVETVLEGPNEFNFELTSDR